MTYIMVIFIITALFGQDRTSGCTDILAVNYDPSATVDDGSCEYSLEISEVTIQLLTSGMVSVSWMTNANAYGYIAWAEDTSEYGYPNVEYEAGSHNIYHAHMLESGMNLEVTYYFTIFQEDETGAYTVTSDEYSFTLILDDTVNPADLAWSDYSSLGDAYLYVANEGGGGGGTDVIQIANDGSAELVATGFNGPSGLDVRESTADLTISDDQSSLYTADTLGNVTTIFSGMFNNPNALFFENDDSLLVADAGSSIIRADLVSETLETLADGFDIPQAVAMYDGDIYFTDYFGYIYRINAEDTTPVDPTTVEYYTSYPVVPYTQGGMVIDSSGNIFVSGYDSGKVYRVNTDGTVDELIDLDVQTRGLALNQDETALYVTGYNDQMIFELDLTSAAFDASILADDTSSGGLLYGPFGLKVTEYDYTPEDDVCDEPITDFEDVPPAVFYYSGDSFTTYGYTVTAQDFQWSGGSWFGGGYVQADNVGLAGGSGNELEINNINLSFDFGAPVEDMDLLFGEYGGNINIQINGDLRNEENLSSLDGVNVGGVDIFVDAGFGNDSGILTLCSTESLIEEFIIGGQELWIDELCIIDCDEEDPGEDPAGCEDPQTDFDDLILGTYYYVGDALDTYGLPVHVAGFEWTDGTMYYDGYARVDGGGLAGGTGYEMLINNVNLDFQFGGPVDNLELLFGEYGGNVNVAVNWEHRNVQNLSELHNDIIGGVHVEVINGFGADTGLIRLTGQANLIDMFVIGGQEFWIDHLCYTEENYEPMGCEDPVTDFDDLVWMDTYYVGDVFWTYGLEIQPEGYLFPDGTITYSGFARVDNQNLAGGSGLDLNLNNINLNFQFPTLVDSLELLFGEYGGNINLALNYEHRNVDNWADLHGQVIGGVFVEILNGFGNDAGLIKLTGVTQAIEQFVIGGQEFWIDDLCYVTAGNEEPFGCEFPVSDFEDLPLFSEYYVGDVFMTYGIPVYPAGFEWSDGTPTFDGYTRVGHSGYAGGSGQEMEINNINLDFQFGGPVDNLELLFGEYGGNVNLSVNYEHRNVENMAELNGDIVGGVLVEVVNGFGNDTGILRLTGQMNPITMFVVGGQEFAIDDLCFENLGQPDDNVFLYIGAVDPWQHTVEVWMDNTVPVSGFQFELNDWPDIIGFTGAYGGVADSHGFSVVSDEEGLVLGFSYDGTAVEPGQTLLTTLSYEGFGETELCFGMHEFTSQGGMMIPSVTGDCMVIGTPLGDVNLDGFVNVTDIVMMIGIIFGDIIPTEEEFWAGDVNSDGTISVTDIVLVVELILYGSLPRDAEIPEAGLNIDSNRILLDSSDSVAGIQLYLTGDYEISSIYCPTGWNCQEQNGILLMFSEDGSPWIGDNVLEYTGDILVEDNTIVVRGGGSVTADIRIQPTEFSMAPAYPNPFNPVTTVSYTMPAAGTLTVNVFDISGRMVAQLYNGEQTEGNHKLNWTATDFASGVYVIRMNTGSSTSFQKVILVK